MEKLNLGAILNPQPNKSEVEINSTKPLKKAFYAIKNLKRESHSLDYAKTYIQKKIGDIPDVEERQKPDKTIYVLGDERFTIKIMEELPENYEPENPVRNAGVIDWLKSIGVANACKISLDYYDEDSEENVSNNLHLPKFEPEKKERSTTSNFSQKTQVSIKEGKIQTALSVKELYESFNSLFSEGSPFQTLFDDYEEMERRSTSLRIESEDEAVKVELIVHTPTHQVISVSCLKDEKVENVTTHVQKLEDVLTLFKIEGL